MGKSQFLSPKSQAGQAIVLIAFMIIVLFGTIGLAVDGGIAYYYNAAAERAAASAALAGVIFMPKQLLPADSIPALAGNDATDRALVAARRNGFDAATNGVPNGPNNVTVTVSRYTDPISGTIQDESLQVTVSRSVATFFMQLFGIPTLTVSRTAVAQYLKPLKLGEPCVSPPGDCHTGATVSQLGNGGFYFLRTEGWSTDRGQGDAYTPNPNSGCASCPSTDVHQISGTKTTEVVNPSLPTPGGYNYILTVPAGFTAQIQVYNAAFAADSGPPAAAPNYCENWLLAQNAPRAKCSPGGNYDMHEQDTPPYGSGNNPASSLYSAMRYTILSAPSVFIRSSDTILSQMTVYPVDASNFAVNPPTYLDINPPAKTITQQYNAITGAPTNMLAYHAWMDVGGYVPNNTCAPPVIGAPGIACAGTNESESAIIKYNALGALLPNTLAGGASGATYRLRIDTLNSDGSVGPGGTQAHKGMAVRVQNGAGTGNCGTAATPCTLSALDDLAIFTPITTPGGGGNFRVPIFSVPAIYAGLTIGIDIFDPGDINAGGGSAFLSFIDPTTCLPFVANGQTATIHDLLGQRSNLGTVNDTIVGNYPSGSTVEIVVNNAGVQPYNGHWLHFEIPIPAAYGPPFNAACDPTLGGYWDLQYRTTAGVTAVDTITITLNLLGNPAHILRS
jgi:Putative Tad-like Flp pilus-assembly